MEKKSKSNNKVGVKVVKANNYDCYSDVITKSDRSEQLTEAPSLSADYWIPHRIDMGIQE